MALENLSLDFSKIFDSIKAQIAKIIIFIYKQFYKIPKQIRIGGIIFIILLTIIILFYIIKKKDEYLYVDY